MGFWKQDTGILATGNWRLVTCLQFLSAARIKNGKPNIAPLQPPTLAAFRPWGSSAGAGRADLPRQN